MKNELYMKLFLIFGGLALFVVATEIRKSSSKIINNRISAAQELKTIIAENERNQLPYLLMNLCF